MESEESGKVLIKAEYETDPGYGCRPEERSIKEHIRKGIVNIDKPSGPNSHQVAAWVRDMFGLKKAGHSGTLDPKVTGVLPIALEDATKIVQVLLLSNKEYVCIMALHDNVPGDALKKTLSYFQGEIFQTPPIKSAVKRELRTRHIYAIKLLERTEKQALYTVRCEAGTYIRKLCHDIGLVLGTGAHMHELRRIKSGPFDESTLVNLQELKDAYEFYREDGDERLLRKVIQPVENGVKDLRKIWLKDTAVSAVCHGADLSAPGVSMLEKNIQKNEKVALYTLKNELAAVGTSLYASREIYERKKGPVVKTKRVFMEADTYPRTWRPKKTNI
ncbi:MAG: RNA-guided pseudouridylation complex pseudouridine synthase subunit Cbf5 [Candidatus Altiarchaeota archaeon]|nr:RNA-guided pseudouridylation complex pseudouridine synthase subunit Cbf5 [Candidatus Altiarchaeota archaeon]